MYDFIYSFFRQIPASCHSTPCEMNHCPRKIYQVLEKVFLKKVFKILKNWN